MDKNKRCILILTTTLAIAFISSQAQVSYSDKPDDTLLNDAVNTLQTNKPSADPKLGLGIVDAAGHKANLELYERQIDAISFIGKARAPCTAQYLIPYLNYSTTNYFGGSGHFGRAIPEDINTTRSYWPAFSALLDIPGSSKVLASYALNKDNPLEFRVACMSALRYLDKEKCKNVAHALLSETSDSENQRELIQAYADGRRPFQGTIFFLGSGSYTIKQQ